MCKYFFQLKKENRLKLFMRFDYVFILILPNCACAFREQEDREQALQDLKSGSVKILIATGWLGF